jgi:predicted nucleic acid-binding protein
VSADRVLVDTSVWVAFFRGADPVVSPVLEDLMREERVAVPPVVLAELVQGAGSEREMRTFEDFKASIPVLDQKDEHWIEAGRLSCELKKHGKTIHLTDCLIAVIARAHDCRILTRDKHFREIATRLDVEVDEI